MGKIEEYLGARTVSDTHLTLDARRGGVNTSVVTSYNEQEADIEATDNVIDVDTFSEENINLASLPSDINGVTLAENITVLLLGQTVLSENGYYIHDGTDLIQQAVATKAKFRELVSYRVFQYIDNALIMPFKELTSPRIATGFPSTLDDIDKYFQRGSKLFYTDSLNSVVQTFTCTDYTDGSPVWTQDGYSVFVDSAYALNTSPYQTTTEFYGQANTVYKVEIATKINTASGAVQNPTFLVSCPAGASAVGMATVTPNYANGGGGYNISDRPFADYSVSPVTVQINSGAGLINGRIAYDLIVTTAGTAGRVGLDITSTGSTESLVESYIKWKVV